MAKTTTAKELLDFLEQVVHDGYGEAEVLLDTEARTFDYHMAKVGRAYVNNETDPEYPFVSLHEQRNIKGE
jgi:hypothetical protein